MVQKQIATRYKAIKATWIRKGALLVLALLDPGGGGFISAFASTVLTEKVTPKLMGQRRCLELRANVKYLMASAHDQNNG